MTLYHSAGDSFELTAHEWATLLTHATRNGWRPGAALPPSISFDVDRPAASLPGCQNDAASCLEVPEGQILPGLDAYRLAAALRKIPPPVPMDGAWLSRFCGFCENGQSLLLSAHRPVPDVPQPAPSPIPMESQLLNLSRAVASAPVGQPQPLGPHAAQELEPVHQQ